MEEADEDDAFLETASIGCCGDVFLNSLIISSSCNCEAPGVLFLHAFSTA